MKEAMKTLRLRDFDYRLENQAYFITTRFDNPDGELFLAELFKALIELVGETHFQCEALVVMPDHVHLIVFKTSPSSESLGDMMRCLKSKSVYLLKSCRMVERSFWKAGYYEHAIRDDRDLKTKMEYLIANPVRAGIVIDPFEYPRLFVNEIKNGATQGRPLRSGKDVSV